MSGYTKLFGSIIASTVWKESKETKIVWITMLAMKNEFDVVEASLPGLADLARLTKEETIEAIKCLESPDEWSRTKDYDGRRIEPVDGGWLVLNGEKYRRLMNAEDQKAKATERKRRSRERLKASNDVTPEVTLCHALSRKSLQEETKAKEKAKEIPPSGGVGGALEGKVKSEKADPMEFIIFWQAYPNRKGRGDALKVWKRLKIDATLHGKIIEAINVQKRSKEWLKDGGAYIPHPATWLNGQRWLDEVSNGPLVNSSPVRKSFDSVLEAQK